MLLAILVQLTSECTAVSTCNMRDERQRIVKEDNASPKCNSKVNNVVILCRGIAETSKI